MGEGEVEGRGWYHGKDRMMIWSKKEEDEGASSISSR